MTSLEWVERNVDFRKPGEPITGKFNGPKYRMIEAPIISLDNPDYRRTVLLKASSCMGTVFLQMAIAYRTARKLGDEMTVTMTDDYAKKWTDVRGKPFILQFPEVKALIRSGTYSITQTLWQFVHKSIYINGPGATKQEGTQLVYLSTDESHLEESYPNGALDNFEKRVGRKWNSHCLHVSTAPTEGRELAELWKASSQDEFHHRCRKCNQLVWMLWPDDSEEANKHYNGEQVFRWNELPSEVMTNESLRFICPHCQHEESDLPIPRFEMQTNGDYVSQGKEFLLQNKGFRWSCFAAHWMDWTGTLVEWRSALNSEQMGNFEPMESFIKRRLCMIYFPRIHGTSGAKGNRDYKTGDVWITEEPKKNFALGDVQDAPFHLWALAVQANTKGETRRLNYCKLDNWTQWQTFITDHQVSPSNVGIDTQHRFSEVLLQCAEHRWYALQNSEAHVFMQSVNGRLHPNPFYGDPIEHDAFLGKQIPKGVILERRKLAVSNPRNFRLPGFAGVIQWNKKRVGFTVLALKGGEWPRYFGIPSNMDDACPDYLPQLNTYAAVILRDSKTNVPSRILKQLSDDDHAFIMECQAFVMMSRAGYFPMDFSAQKEDESAA